MHSRPILWFFAFLSILILSQFPSFIPFKTNGLILGLPIWLWCFILIHIIFIWALYRFSRRAQNSEEE